MITVYTAIFGDYDKLKKQPKQSVPCAFLCYTDWDQEQEGWVVAKEDKFKHLHPRMKAKRYRLHPFRYESCYNNQYVVYIDWSWQIKSPKFIETVVNQLIEKDLDILTFQHPLRDCIFDEAEASMDMPKYKGLPIMQQALHYINVRKYPYHNWLSASGMLVIRRSQRVHQMLHDRWQENLMRTYQDQISFWPVAWKHGIKHGVFTENDLPVNLRDNQYIDFLNPHKNDL